MIYLQKKAVQTLFMSLRFWGALSTILFLTTCKKDKWPSGPSRMDSVYVYSDTDTCKDIKGLPINCFSHEGNIITTSDTFLMQEGECIWFGNCADQEFTPIYRVCLRSIYDYRVPDTAMCRADSLPLCCPDDYFEAPSMCWKYYPYPDDFWDVVGGPDKPIDVAVVSFRAVAYCYLRQGFVYSAVLFGNTRNLSHPDSLPNFSCDSYLAYYDTTGCRRLPVGECVLEVKDVVPRPDSVQQATTDYHSMSQRITCCTGAYSPSLLNVTPKAKVVLSCNQ